MMPRIFLVLFALILVSLSAQAQNFGIKDTTKKETEASPTEKIDAPFDRLQDHAWALVLTGPEDDPLYVQELALLETEAETLKSREMVVIHFHGRTLKAYLDLSVADYKLPSLSGSRSGSDGERTGESSHKKIDRLEKQLQTDDDVFSVVLVDMDGVTKYVWTELVTPKNIYRVMDDPNVVPFQKLEPVPAEPAPKKGAFGDTHSLKKSPETLKK
jgi:hypothetical protein